MSNEKRLRRNERGGSVIHGLEIIHGDALSVLKTLASNSIHCCVTSPPYWGLRDYGVSGQIGLEQSMDEYCEKLVTVFSEVMRVLRNDGTLWLNLGDSYVARATGGRFKFKVSDKQHSNAGSGMDIWKPIHGLKSKDLCGIPWRVAFALQADGWYLRQDIIWHKPNPMPESVRDRCTKAHEYIFLFAKSKNYYFNHKDFLEPVKSKPYDICRMKEGRPRTAGKWFDQKDNKLFNTRSKLGHSNKVGNGIMRNRRSVWSVTTKPFKGAHFATFPTDLITPCILAGCPPGGVVLDPFCGAGTVGVVCKKNNRQFVGIDLNPAYVKMAEDRIASIPRVLNFTNERKNNETSNTDSTDFNSSVCLAPDRRN